MFSPVFNLISFVSDIAGINERSIQDPYEVIRNNAQIFFPDNFKFNSPINVMFN